jgi:hypothetical protein
MITNHLDMGVGPTPKTCVSNIFQTLDNAHHNTDITPENVEQLRNITNSHSEN